MASTVTVDGSPGALDFKIRRGDQIPPVQLDWGTTDLSDRTWEAQVRADLDEGALVATMTVDVSEAGSGKIVVSLPASQSRLLVTGTTGDQETPGKGRYFWDLQATRTADPEDVKTWFSGKIDVSGDVTMSA